MDTINEYRVKVSVRNNLILQAIEDAGYVSVAGFCRAMGIHKIKSVERINNFPYETNK